MITINLVTVYLYALIFHEVKRLVLFPFIILFFIMFIYICYIATPLRNALS